MVLFSTQGHRVKVGSHCFKIVALGNIVMIIIRTFSARKLVHRYLSFGLSFIVVNLNSFIKLIKLWSFLFYLPSQWWNSGPWGIRIIWNLQQFNQRSFNRNLCQSFIGYFIFFCFKSDQFHLSLLSESSSWGGGKCIILCHCVFISTLSSHQSILNPNYGTKQSSCKILV